MFILKPSSNIFLRPHAARHHIEYSISPVVYIPGECLRRTPTHTAHARTHARRRATRGHRITLPTCTRARARVDVRSTCAFSVLYSISCVRVRARELLLHAHAHVRTCGRAWMRSTCAFSALFYFMRARARVRASLTHARTLQRVLVDTNNYTVLCTSYEVPRTMYICTGRVICTVLVRGANIHSTVRGTVRTYVVRAST